MWTHGSAFPAALSEGWFNSQRSPSAGGARPVGTRAPWEARSSHTGLKQDVSVALPGQAWKARAALTTPLTAGAAGIRGRGRQCLPNLPGVAPPTLRPQAPPYFRRGSWTLSLLGLPLLQGQGGWGRMLPAQRVGGRLGVLRCWVPAPRETAEFRGCTGGRREEALKLFSLKRI